MVPGRNGIADSSGVEQASAANPLPLAGNQDIRKVGRTDLPEAPPILATQQVALRDYLGVIGKLMIAGRDFSDSDVAAERNVTIVDECWGTGVAMAPDRSLAHNLGLHAAKRRLDTRFARRPRDFNPKAMWTRRSVPPFATTVACWLLSVWSLLLST